jgi:hypothetical protein
MYQFAQVLYVCRCLGQCLAIGAEKCRGPLPPTMQFLGITNLCCGAVGMTLLYAASVISGRRRCGGREVPDNAYVFLRTRARARARERRPELRMLQRPVSSGDVEKGGVLLSEVRSEAESLSPAIFRIPANRVVTGCAATHQPAGPMSVRKSSPE